MPHPFGPRRELNIDFWVFDLSFSKESVMRNLSDELRNSKTLFRFMMLVAVVSTLAALAPLSTAATPPLTITVVNNSGGELSYLFLSPADNNNWGPDQLNGSSISPGTTRNLNVSWDQSTVKLVAEDQDGGFLSTTVAATGTPVWTSTSDTTRDCGN